MPEALVEAIEAHRAESAAQSEAKVLAFADRAGWSDGTTDAVLGLVTTAHADVDRLLADVTEGKRPWREVKAEVRDVRMEQARAIREELGDDDFADFARALASVKGRGRGRGGRPGRRGPR